MVQMHMQAGLDNASCFMLNLRQVLHQAALTMRIHEGDYAHPLALHIAHPFVMNDVVSNGISDAL